MKFPCKHTCSFFAASIMLALCTMLLLASNCLAEDLVLSFGTGENASVTVTSDKDIEFSSFKVNNPYRLVVDIKNISVATTEYVDKHKQIPRILVNKTTSGSRIILEPVAGVQLMTRQDSARSITILGVLAQSEKSALTSTVAGSTPHTSKAALPDGLVTANTLIIKDDTITLGTNGLVGSISTFSFPETNRFVFVLADTKLDIKLGFYKLDFLNLTGMDVEQQGSNAKLTFYAMPKTTFPNYFSAKDVNATHIRFFATDAVASGGKNANKMVIDGNQKSVDIKRFKGQRISLDFDNADVRHIIRLLSEVNKKNYMLTNEAKGTLSLKLINVPWDQALELILKNNNLVALEDGSVTEVITFNQQVERIKNQLEIKDFEKNQEQVGICSVQLRHAAAAKVAESANTILTRGAKESTTEKSSKALAAVSANKTLSLDNNKVDVSADAKMDGKYDSKVTDFSINNIFAEPNTNRLIIRDFPSKFPEILKILSLLDIPDQQVMIEARIVTASTEFVKSLGVQWGVHYRDPSSTVWGINSFDTGFGGLASPGPSSGTSGPGMNTGVSFGTLASNIKLDLRLSAAASAFMAKTISTPRVAVTYGETANIKDGTQIPYNKLNVQTGQTTTEFKDANLSLTVTPTITPACDVVMNIEVTNDTPGAPIKDAIPINVKFAKTKLTVKSGDTAVIGGTYVKTDSESDTGVPFLMTIPLLGGLFKSKENLNTNRELLIFITPKLLNFACDGSKTMEIKYEKLECTNF